MGGGEVGGGVAAEGLAGRCESGGEIRREGASRLVRSLVGGRQLSGGEEEREATRLTLRSIADARRPVSLGSRSSRRPTLGRPEKECCIGPTTDELKPSPMPLVAASLVRNIARGSASFCKVSWCRLRKDCSSSATTSFLLSSLGRCHVRDSSAISDRTARGETHQSSTIGVRNHLLVQRDCS